MKGVVVCILMIIMLFASDSLIPVKSVFQHSWGLGNLGVRGMVQWVKVPASKPENSIGLRC